MATASEGLYIGQVVKEAYDRLCKQHPHQDITFEPDLVFESPIAKTVLAQETSNIPWIGYMGYRGAKIFNLNGHTWVVAHGTPMRSHPRDGYMADLFAMPIELEGKTGEQIRDEVRAAIEANSFLENSLLYARETGELGTKNTNCLGAIARELIAPAAPQHRSTTGERTLYAPGFAGYIADTVAAVLSDEHEALTLGH
ncbi:MAG: hypothetical protein ABIE94_05670 [archaeon]